MAEPTQETEDLASAAMIGAEEYAGAFCFAKGHGGMTTGGDPSEVILWLKGRDGLIYRLSVRPSPGNDWQALPVSLRGVLAPVAPESPGAGHTAS